MSEKIPQQGQGLGNQLYDEAADWFAKLRGPDAKSHKAGFDAWLARGALHRAAYNRIAEIFTDSGGIERQVPPSREPPAHSWSTGQRSLVLLILALGLVLSFILLLYDVDRWPTQTQDVELSAGSGAPGSLASAVGEIRRVRLTDGSMVTLDTDSLVIASFTRTGRRLRLVRGQARFEVAHETRPFSVAAGTGLVTARGTIFDIRLRDRGKVSVLLLRGAIDVVVSDQRQAPVQRLEAGESTSFTNIFATDRPVAKASDNRWPTGMAEFHDTALSDVIMEANRYSLTPIVVGDDGIKKLRVSGIFSLRDPKRLCDRLTHLFHLGCRNDQDRILLVRKEGAKK